MNTELFWSMIEKARQHSNGNTESQDELLIEDLILLPVEDIQEFDRILWMLMAQTYRTDLWDTIWIIGCGCGDDAFHDFRNWLIAQGQAVYEKVIEDPENLLDVIDKKERFNSRYSSIVQTAELAYERKTKHPIPETGYREKLVLVGGAVTPENEIYAKYPRIIAKIGGCDDEELFN